MSVAASAGVPASASTAATVAAVLFVPAPTISCAARSLQTVAHASMTARFSSALSALASPVVPSATMPVAPASRYSWQSRVTASSATEPSAANGVMSGT